MPLTDRIAGSRCDPQKQRNTLGRTSHARQNPAKLSIVIRLNAFERCASNENSSSRKYPSEHYWFELFFLAKCLECFCPVAIKTYKDTHKVYISIISFSSSAARSSSSLPSLLDVAELSAVDSFSGRCCSCCRIWFILCSCSPSRCIMAAESSFPPSKCCLTSRRVILQ